MRLKGLYLLLSALGACAVSRPDGAFIPDSSTDTRIVGFGDDAGEMSDDEDPPPEDDSEVVEEPDAGDPDAIPVDPSDPLAALAGRYLMRMDYYSTASGSSAGNTLTLNNRVSNLFYTELTLVDGVLQANEQLCFQNYFHTCVRGCRDPWTTAVDSDLPRFFAKRSVKRPYEVDAEGNLSARTELMTLGYDDNDPNASSVPAKHTDANVWKLGDGSDPTRAGVRTLITATLLAGGALPVPVSLSCVVDSAQLFSTAFTTKLAKLDAASLTSQSIPLQSSGSVAKAIYASGDPSEVCDVKQLDSGDPGRQEAFVRFQAAGTFRGCPRSAAEFDKAFAASPATR
jgi:hypothetical protein